MSPKDTAPRDEIGAREPARYYPFAWDHAGYTRGRYVVVTGLTPLSAPLIDHDGVVQADARVLQGDRERPAYLAGKRASPQLDGCDPALRLAVRDRLLDEARVAYGLTPDAAPTLDALVGRLQEDVVVATLVRNGSRLVYAHVSHPSGWDPETLCVAGVTSFARLHAALAVHMGAGAVRGLAGEPWIRTIAHDPGGYRRFTWGLQFDPGLDQHPRRRPPMGSPPRLWLRVERQVAIGFPAHDAMLFLIRPYVVPLHAVRDDGVLDCLLGAVRGMDAGQARYKLGDHRDAVLCALADAAAA